LDWSTALTTSPGGAAPPADGSHNNTNWYGSAGYMNVAITGTSLIRAYDYALVNTGSGWQSIQCCWPPHAFTGNFDSAPDAGFDTAGVGIHLGSYHGGGPYGEALLGSYNAGSFVIGSATVMSSFGFRISSITTPNFDVTINLFGSEDGTGSYEQLTLSNLSGGGNCAGLSTLTPAVTGAPTPCNTAPFIVVNTTSAVHSFSLQTSDSTGFYIDALDLSADPNPEPATIALTGGALMMLAYGIRRKRAAVVRK
jgi:hypothetical protein